MTDLLHADHLETVNRFDEDVRTSDEETDRRWIAVNYVGRALKYLPDMSNLSAQESSDIRMALQVMCRTNPDIVILLKPEYR